MLKRALALTLSLLLLCAAALGETTRYGEVFDAQGDAGRLTVRFLWLGPQVAEDKPGDAMILTSPDGKVMVLDAGHPQAAEYVTAALAAFLLGWGGLSVHCQSLLFLLETDLSCKP